MSKKNLRSPGDVTSELVTVVDLGAVRVQVTGKVATVRCQDTIVGVALVSGSSPAEQTFQALDHLTASSRISCSDPVDGSPSSSRVAWLNPFTGQVALGSSFDTDPLVFASAGPVVMSGPMVTGVLDGDQLMVGDCVLARVPVEQLYEQCARTLAHVS